MTVRIVGQGVDTLHVGVYAEQRDHVWRALERLRDLARQAGSRVPEAVGDVVHQVGPAKSPWQYQLACPSWTVMACERGERDLAPPFSLQLRSEFLWAFGAPAALEAAVARVMPHLAGPVSRTIVQRADLAVDFVGWLPRAGDTPHFVRQPRHVVLTFVDPRRRTREVELRALTARELRRRVEDLEAESEVDMWGAMQFTGWRWGRGDIVARLYDKTAEIVQASGKTWFYDVWSEGGELPEFCEEAQPVVWRLEFQLRRQALKEFGIDTPEDLWQKAPRLWAALAGTRREDPLQAELYEQGEGEPPDEREVGWLTLREPQDDSHRYRWPVRPEWRALQDGPWGLVGQPLIRDRRRRMDWDLALARTVRGLVQCAVLAGEPCTDPDAIWRWASERGLVREYFAASPHTLEGVAADFRARVPPDVPALQRPVRR